MADHIDTYFRVWFCVRAWGVGTSRLTKPLRLMKLIGTFDENKIRLISLGCYTIDGNMDIPGLYKGKILVREFKKSKMPPAILVTDVKLVSEYE